MGIYKGAGSDSRALNGPGSTPDDLLLREQSVLASRAHCISHGMHSGEVWLGSQSPEIGTDVSSVIGIYGPAPGHCPDEGEYFSNALH